MSPPDSRAGLVAARRGETRRAAGATRAQARAPRSGGRTAAQQPGGRAAGRGTGRRDPGRRPDRDGPATAYPTHGSAALAAPATATAPAGAARARLQVAPPAPVAVPRAPFVVLILLVVVGGVLGVLLLNTQINENAFHLHDLRARQVVLDHREQQLEQQIAEAESPGTLAAAARRLGLVPAGEPAFLRLEDGAVAGEPVPATGTPSRTSQQDED